MMLTRVGAPPAGSSPLGDGTLSSVHGQPVLPDGGGGSSRSVGHFITFFLLLHEEVIRIIYISSSVSAAIISAITLRTSQFELSAESSNSMKPLGSRNSSQFSKSRLTYSYVWSGSSKT